MDCAEVRGESPAEEQLEPLLILEEGDEPEEFTNNTAREKGVLRMKKTDEDVGEDSSGIKGCVEKSVDTNAKVEECKSEEVDVDVNERKVEKLEGQQEEVLENEGGGPEQVTGTKENLSEGRQEDSEVSTVETGAGLARTEKVAGKEMEGPLLETDVVAKDKLHVPPDVQSSAKLRPKDRLRPEDAQQKFHRLSPDFPDTLYELLCTLQEGRRLNDQRCSFRLEGRRRCYSEPSTPRHSQRVVFSSMTSLQKEEFFDFLATSQARRLDDQRAEFQSLSPVPSSPEPQHSSSSPTPSTSIATTTAAQTKVKPRKGSCKALEASRTVPKPPPKEELYNMILTSQAQGRLEEQRSKPPGPMDDEDFFSLLLKVQGGRMDEQRTELPVALKY
ncbi:uncharacterized protein LOC118799177 [Colossoma macropomum]|uniref:uncharacterized protein LOC118799177 n=1 Tax=Colossoma macropomum TaxID=42526 RepID=UPI0018655082|nr:uncharacterized protein LOC118799177 [Colossoma macropomum]